MNQTEDFATSVGRILFAVPFLVFGILHFLQGGAMAGVVPSWMPGSVIWVYLTGAANLVAGISIAADRYIRVVAIALVGMLVSFVLTVHLPGVLAEGSSQMALTNLLKDVGLAGGALMLLGLED
jgi:uncharacterized membrane protein